MRTKIIVFSVALLALMASAGAVSLGWIGWNVRHVVHFSLSDNSLSSNSISTNSVRFEKVGIAAQCTTTFVDNSVPIASNVLGVSLSSAGVDTANTKLQSDISSNSPGNVIGGDVLAFRGQTLILAGDVLSNVTSANQLRTLRNDLNGSVLQYKGCLSTNSVSPFGLGGIGGVFARGHFAMHRRHFGRGK